MDRNCNISELKNIKIDDLKIKNLIKNYFEDPSRLYQIIEYLSPFIYSFPRLVSKSMDEDDCSNFYEYILKRISKIISQYSEKEIKFVTWFSVVLRRHFLNWVNTKIQNNREIAILNSPIANDIKDEIISKIVYEEHHSQNENINIRNLINTLPIKYQIILKLHYFDFFKEEDIFDIIDSFGGNFNLHLSNYHKLLDKSKDFEKDLNGINDRIGKTFNKLQDLLYNEKKHKEYSDWLNNFMTENDDYITKQREMHRSNLKKLRNTYLSLKPKDIADFLSISIKDVYNLLHNGRLLLKEKIINDQLL